MAGNGPPVPDLSDSGVLEPADRECGVGAADSEEGRQNMEVTARECIARECIARECKVSP